METYYYYALFALVVTGTIVYSKPNYIQIGYKLVNSYLDLKYKIFPPASLNTYQASEYQLKAIEIITLKPTPMSHYIAVNTPCPKFCLDQDWLDNHNLRADNVNLHYTYNHQSFIYPIKWEISSNLKVNFPPYTTMDLDSSLAMTFDEIKIDGELADPLKHTQIHQFAGPKGNFYEDLIPLQLNDLWYSSELPMSPAVRLIPDHKSLELTDMLGKEYKFKELMPIHFSSFD